MVAFKNNELRRSTVTTRMSELMTDTAFLLIGWQFFGRLGASTNGAGKRSLAWSQSRERFAWKRLRALVQLKDNAGLCGSTQSRRRRKEQLIKPQVFRSDQLAHLSSRVWHAFSYMCADAQTNNF
jgi:hypothetical protein